MSAYLFSLLSKQHWVTTLQFGCVPVNCLRLRYGLSFNIWAEIEDWRGFEGCREVLTS